MSPDSSCVRDLVVTFYTSDVISRLDLCARRVTLTSGAVHCVARDEFNLPVADPGGE